MVHDYFKGTMTQYIREIKPDYFIILLDTFMLHGGDAWFLKVDTAPTKTFFWFPSDGGGGLPIGCEHILRKVDCPVAMAEFGQKQCNDFYQLKTEHIPHGVDPDRFYPLEEQKRKELKAKWGLQDKFVIGIVARNQPRKNLDRAIKTMHLVRQKIPNAILFLHMDPDDLAQPTFKMRSLIQKYNLENHVVFSGMKAHKGFGWDQMNEIYNLMDVFFLPTSGEGFGIPIIEAMSCEIPVLATDYTTTPELVLKNKAGLGINLTGTQQIDMFNNNLKEYDIACFDGTLTGSWEVERGMCSIQDAASKLLWLFLNPDKRKEMGENGRDAVLRKYDFNKIVGPKWEKLMFT